MNPVTDCISKNNGSCVNTYGYCFPNNTQSNCQWNCSNCAYCCIDNLCGQGPSCPISGGSIVFIIFIIALSGIFGFATFKFFKQFQTLKTVQNSYDQQKPYLEQDQNQIQQPLLGQNENQQFNQIYQEESKENSNQITQQQQQQPQPNNFIQHLDIQNPQVKEGTLDILRNQSDFANYSQQIERAQSLDPTFKELLNGTQQQPIEQTQELSQIKEQSNDNSVMVDQNNNNNSQSQQ